MKSTHPVMLLLFAIASFAGPMLHADSVHTQAGTLLQKGDLPAAEALLLPLVEASPPDAAALHLLGQVRLAQKRGKEAIALAEQAIQADPSVAAHFSQLGVACSSRMPELGFMQQAMLAGKMREAFEKSIELDPNHVPGLIGLARYFANAPEIAGGSFGKAREYATRVEQLQPWLGQSELGRIAERQEDFATALKHYDAAVQLKPDNPALLVASGRVLVQLDRKDEARGRFTAALGLNPKFEPARHALEQLAAP